mmetsp:Transcript_8251/g.17826  ORF Transcript_8251/g.17826 Transcript_8251/m.17826 type:complete len:213 (-) Transcript_8251:1041-1679(-)
MIDEIILRCLNKKIVYMLSEWLLGKLIDRSNFECHARYFNNSSSTTSNVFLSVSNQSDQPSMSLSMWGSLEKKQGTPSSFSNRNPAAIRTSRPPTCRPMSSTNLGWSLLTRRKLISSGLRTICLNRVYKEPRATSNAARSSFSASLMRPICSRTPSAPRLGTRGPATLDRPASLPPGRVAPLPHGVVWPPRRGGPAPSPLLVSFAPPKFSVG